MVQENRRNKLTVILLTVYLLALFWIILLKMSTSLSQLPSLRGVNLIPFAESVVINGSIHMYEIIGNAIIFVPFGIYITMLRPEWRLSKRLLLIVAVTLLLEVMQFIFAIGASDITDLIMNTLGGMIGIGFFTIFRKIIRSEDRAVKIMNVFAFVGTLFMSTFIMIILFADRG